MGVISRVGMPPLQGVKVTVVTVKMFVSAIVLAVLFFSVSAQARPRDNNPCSNGCVTLHQTVDGLVIVTALDAAGNVLATDAARVGASSRRGAHDIFWPAHDWSLAYERVNGQFVALAAMQDHGSETTPLPGGGAVTIIHQGGYDVIVTIGPDGTVIDVRIQVTTKAR